MKRIIKISSLGLVVLLTSCASKVAPLKKISPIDAISVASVITNQRRGDGTKLDLLDQEARSKNELFKSKAFPYLKKKMSADITIKHDGELTYPNAPYLNIIESRTIKKHIYFDLDKLFYYCKLDMTYTTNDGATYVFPKAEHYTFFIENPEQEEGITSEYDKKGQVFMLYNFDDLLKVSTITDENLLIQTKQQFIKQFLYDYFMDNSPIISYEMPFSLRNASSFGLTDVTMNWSPMNYYLQSLTGDQFTVGATTQPLFIDSCLTSIETNIVNKYLNTFKPYFDDLNDPESYLYLTFKSGNESSFSIETDFSINEDDEALEKTGRTTETSSVIFRNAYLSENHFDFKSDIQVKVLGSLTHTYTSTTFDQSINYNPSDNIGIPPDYLDYNPGL